ILPESLRRTPANEESVYSAISSTPVTVLVDAGIVKTEYRDASFPEVLDRLLHEVGPMLERGEARYYSLKLVTGILREQVLEMMGELRLGEKEILKLITDWNLLTELARLQTDQARDVAKFLAAY